VPIPRTQRIERLDENVAAVAVELTDDDLREIQTAASTGSTSRAPATPNTCSA